MTVRAELIGAGDGRAVEISVSDEGIGIAPSDFDRIFTDFSQIDGSATRRYGGLGLGLPFVQRVVAAHGGRSRPRRSPATARRSRWSCRSPAGGAGATAPARGASEMAYGQPEPHRHRPAVERHHHRHDGRPRRGRGRPRRPQPGEGGHRPPRGLGLSSRSRSAGRPSSGPRTAAPWAPRTRSGSIDGSAVLDLPHSSKVELRPGSAITVNGAAQPEVWPSTTATSSSRPARATPSSVDGGTSLVSVAGGGQAPPGRLAGRRRLRGHRPPPAQRAGAVTIPQYRQAAVVGTGIMPQAPEPLSLSATDEWDRRELGPVMALDEQLTLVRPHLRGAAPASPDADFYKSISPTAAALPITPSCSAAGPRARTSSA